MLRAFAAQPGRTAETKGTGRRGLGISDEVFWHFFGIMFSIVSDGKSTYFCMILYVYLSKRKLYQHIILIYSQCYPPMCPNVAGQQRFGNLPNELNLHFVRGFSSQPRLVTGG